MPPKVNPELHAHSQLQSTRTVMRSISLPVAECLSMRWSDFNKLLHASWRLKTPLTATQILIRPTRVNP